MEFGSWMSARAVTVRYQVAITHDSFQPPVLGDFRQGTFTLGAKHLSFGECQASNCGSLLQGEGPEEKARLPDILGI
jgi:hypothetical protein